MYKMCYRKKNHVKNKSKSAICTEWTTDWLLLSDGISHWKEEDKSNQVKKG